MRADARREPRFTALADVGALPAAEGLLLRELRRSAGAVSFADSRGEGESSALLADASLFFGSDFLLGVFLPPEGGLFLRELLLVIGPVAGAVAPADADPWASS